MTKLVEKRAALIEEYNKIKTQRDTEQRAAYSNEEFEKINSISVEIDDLDKQIKTEKEMEAKRNAKLDAMAPNNPVAKRDYVSEFRSFLNGESSEGKFTIPYNEFTRRAAITTSSNSQFSYTDQHSPLSINDSELVLDKIGVPVYLFDSGSQDFPSITQIIGSFGTEDNSVSDQTLTSAKITLQPTFVSASLEVTKKFIATSKPENIASLISELRLGLDKAVEKRCIDSMNSLTAAVSTGATVTFHSGTTVMEGALIGAPTAYIFSRTGIQAAKNKKIDAGSGRLVYDNQTKEINGYPAVRSSLQTQANYAYLVDAKALAKAYWGDVQIEAIQDAALARKGSVLLICSVLADSSYLDANKVAVAKNVHQWT